MKFQIGLTGRLQRVAELSYVEGAFLLELTDFRAGSFDCFNRLTTEDFVWMLLMKEPRS